MNVLIQVVILKKLIILNHLLNGIVHSVLMEKIKSYVEQKRILSNTYICIINVLNNKDYDK